MAGTYSNLGIDLLLDDDGDLVVGPDGDLELTPDGSTTLLQDVENLLDTLPGDLFGHPSYGAGVARLFGEENSSDFEALAIRAISDALAYDPSVAPRIKTESISVSALRGSREIRFNVSFKALADGVTSRLNLVWGLNKITKENL